MKEVLYKKESKIYTNYKYKDCSPINYYDRIDNLNNMDLEDIFWTGMQRPEKATSKYPLYLNDIQDSSEETYSENFGNPIWSVNKQYFMVLVEKEEHKVSIKLFYGFRNRKPGVSWFKIGKEMDFISVNTKTGDVYHGGMKNYHLKRKCRKRMVRNYFLYQPLSSMMSMIKNNYKGVEDAGTVAIDAVTTFMNHVDPTNELGDGNFNQRLFKFYLSKRGVKFPNNFYVFCDFWFGPEIKKILKKNDNRMVDSVMVRYNLSGKQVKKALHSCDNFNVGLYEMAKETFGTDWLNQDDSLILSCFNFKGSVIKPEPTFFEHISNEELKRVFSLFKEVVVSQTLDIYTFSDHIRMYTELKRFGETDLKWISTTNNTKTFREEHLDWTDKIDHYRRGNYTRIYPEYSYDEIQKPIIVGEKTYYPILLDNSDNYNQESALQSNCVKTYIGKAGSIIISLRDGSDDSSIQATIEYKLINENDNLRINRVQSLGRFNSRLGQEWDDVLLKLDERMLYYIEDERFDTVKIKKVCKNGVVLNSTTYWNDNGHLRWTEKIDQRTSTYNDEFF